MQLRTCAHADDPSDAVARNFDMHPVTKRRRIVFETTFILGVTAVTVYIARERRVFSHHLPPTLLLNSSV